MIPSQHSVPARAARAARALCALVLALAPGGPAARAQQAALPPPPAEDWLQRELPDLTLATLEGGTVRLRDGAGERTVLAFVRADQELSRAVLTDLQAELAALCAERVRVLAVVAAESPLDVWRALASERGLGFPIALDQRGRLLGAVGSDVLPVTVVVDEQGRVAARIFLHRASFPRDLARRLERASATEAQAERERAAAAQARQAALSSALELSRTGDSAGALVVVQRLRALYPAHYPTRLKLGRILVDLGRPADALDDFRAARELAPASLPATVWHGIALARSGAAEEAEGLLRSIDTAFPALWRARGELAGLARRRGDSLAALRLWPQVLADAPARTWNVGGAREGTNAPTVRALDLSGGASRPVVGRFRRRPRVVQFWTSAGARSALALEELARLQAAHGDGVEWVPVNVDRRRFSPDERLQVLAAAQAAGQAASTPLTVWLDDDLESFERFDVCSIPTTLLIDPDGVVLARVEGPDLAALARRLAAALERIPALGDELAEKRAQREAAREADERAGGPVGPIDPLGRPAAPDVVHQRTVAMARRLARLGRTRAALDCALPALADPSSAGGDLALAARLLVVAGRPAEAVELLTGAVAERSDAALLTLLGDSLVELGAVERAEDAYRRALRAGPEHAPARAGLGLLLALEGAPHEALPELSLALELDPHDGRARYGMGRALEILGRLDEALDAYEQAYRIRWEREGALSRDP